MLQKPTIFKVPSATSQNGFGGDNGCGYYNGNRDFRCNPYGSDCVDTSYSPPCGWTLAGVGITAVGSVAAVVALT